MKDKIEKQEIKKMAKIIAHTEWLAMNVVGASPSPTMYAKDLYWRGYRRQRDGEWVWRSNGYKNRLHCSICNKPNEADIPTKFCPNCGAHMKVGE